MFLTRKPNKCGKSPTTERVKGKSRSSCGKRATLFDENRLLQLFEHDIVFACNEKCPARKEELLESLEILLFKKGSNKRVLAKAILLLERELGYDTETPYYVEGCLNRKEVDDVFIPYESKQTLDGETLNLLMDLKDLISDLLEKLEEEEEEDNDKEEEDVYFILGPEEHNDPFECSISEWDM